MDNQTRDAVCLNCIHRDTCGNVYKDENGIWQGDFNATCKFFHLLVCDNCYWDGCDYLCGRCQHHRMWKGYPEEKQNVQL